MVTLVITMDPWYALLPAGHPLAARGCAHVESLARVPYVMSDCGCEPAILALFERAGVRPDVRHHVLGTDTLIRMVAAGMGWTLLPGLAISAEATTGAAAGPDGTV